MYASMYLCIYVYMNVGLCIYVSMYVYPGLCCEDSRTCPSKALEGASGKTYGLI